MLRSILARSRYLILIAVIGSLLASVIALLYGGLTVLGIVFEEVTQRQFTAEGAKPLALACIEVRSVPAWYRPLHYRAGTVRTLHRPWSANATLACDCEP